MMFGNIATYDVWLQKVTPGAESRLRESLFISFIREQWEKLIYKSFIFHRRSKRVSRDLPSVKK